jgi:hypothetical protein
MPISVGNADGAKRKINHTERYVVCERKVGVRVWVWAFWWVKGWVSVKKKIEYLAEEVVSRCAYERVKTQKCMSVCLTSSC